MQRDVRAAALVERRERLAKEREAETAPPPRGHDAQQVDEAAGPGGEADDGADRPLFRGGERPEGRVERGPASYVGSSANASETVAWNAASSPRRNGRGRTPSGQTGAGGGPSRSIAIR